jgi:8-oxo-dGTP diphosphatase
MINYSLGFVFTQFTEWGNDVLLLLKNRPEEQKGKYNGIGGKIEENELPRACMSREAHEETNLIIPQGDWKYLGIIQKPEYRRIYVFYVVVSADMALTVPDGCPEGHFSWVLANSLPSTTMENVSWIIAFAESHMKGENYRDFLVTYAS